MPTREESILYQVAFKGAIELVANGIIELETDDFGAEVFAVADVFYDGLTVKAGQEDSGKPTKKSFGSSKSKGSTQRGNTNDGPITIKEPNAPASDAQLRKIKSELKKADIRYNRNGFELDGNEFEFDELSKQEASDIIEELMS